MILFATGLTAIQVFPILMPGAVNEAEHLNLDETFLVPMILLMGPVLVAAAMGLSVLASHAVSRKVWYKMLFNMGQRMLAAGVSAWVGHLIGGVFGAVAGGMLFAVLTMLAVNGLISVLDHVPLSRRLLADVPLRVVLVSSALVLGVAMARTPSMFAPIAFACVGAQMWFQQAPFLKGAYAPVPTDV